MPLPGYWPLLGEGVNPVFAVPVAGEAVDVLHYSIALVVGLFDQKTVVLDSLLAEGRNAQKNENENTTHALLNRG